MSSRFHSTVRFLLLLFYGIYSLSPIYASTPTNCSDCRDHRRHSHPYSVGIVWVNVVLSSLADDEIDGQGPAGEASLSEDTTDLILIKKKRAVLREQDAVPSPPPSISTLPVVPTGQHLAACRVREIPLDLKHRESDGYSTLHAGLSPPVHLS